MEKNHSNNMNALIIDDDIAVCDLLVFILKDKNIQTNFVHTISQAKITLETYDPYLILIDNNLPDGLGLNFIKDLKKIKPEAKIIMVTCDYTYPLKDLAIDEGAFDFINKPFSLYCIYKTIDRVFYSMN